MTNSPPPPAEHSLRPRRALGVLFWLGMIITAIALILVITRPDFFTLIAAILTGSYFRLTLIFLILGAILLGMVILREHRQRRVRVAQIGVACIVVALAFSAWHAFGAYRRERVEFTSDGITLVGTLFTPRGGGKFPALVLVGGSGDVPRGPYDLVADRLARQGFIILNPDKRGIGESGGDFADVSDAAPEQVAQRARDAVAGVEALASKPEVIHEQIGLWAVSQGGWVAPVAAGMSSRIAFMLMMSGPATSTGEENAFSKMADDEGDHFGYKPPPIPFEEINRRMESVAPSGFDPREALARMRVPSLWLFGEWDNSIPVVRSVKTLDSLRTAGIPIAIKTFASANHGLMIVRGPDKHILPYFAPDSWETMAAWLHTVTRSTQ